MSEECIIILIIFYMISAIWCKNNYDKGLQVVHTVIQHHIINNCFKDQIIFVKSFSMETISGRKKMIKICVTNLVFIAQIHINDSLIDDRKKESHLSADLTTVFAWTWGKEPIGAEDILL